MMKIIQLSLIIFLCSLSIGAAQTSENDFYNSGLTFFQIGKFETAIKNFSMAISIDSNYSDAYRDRGAAYFSLGQYKIAIQDFNQAIEINPKDWKAYNNRALTKSLLQDYRGGIDDYTKAIEINPNGESYTGRGEAKLGLGLINSGCRDLSKGGELGTYRAYEQIRKFCR